MKGKIATPVKAMIVFTLIFAGLTWLRIRVEGFYPEMIPGLAAYYLIWTFVIILAINGKED